MLTSPDFELSRGEHAHDQFWRVLVNQSHDFTNVIAHDALETLVDYLPRYSAFENDDRGLRQRSIYSLVRLLDRAGWGRTSGRRRVNSAENVLEIAWRIFGEHTYQGKGLLEQLASPQRGILGWNDLMLFRLQCSADRQGQNYNLHRALIVDQDMTAPTSGLVSELALMGMRKMSQAVFAQFNRKYIEPKRNFLAEANKEPVTAYLGVTYEKLKEEASRDPWPERAETVTARRVSSARSVVKSFVIYQLSNARPPNGSGVGCGYYDQIGAADGGGIAKVMNDYVFGICFNPEADEDNALLFLDHCLAHLSSPFFSDRDDAGFVPTKAELPGGLDPKAIGRYWTKYRDLIRLRAEREQDRIVVMPSYFAFYRDDLDAVYEVLDELAQDSAPTEEDLDAPVPPG